MLVSSSDEPMHKKRVDSSNTSWTVNGSIRSAQFAIKRNKKTIKIMQQIINFRGGSL